MITRFNRNYVLTITFSENEELVIQPPINIQFQAEKSDGTYGLNKLSLKIYNLSELKRNRLIKDEEDTKSYLGEYIKVNLSVGYNDEMRTIFQGNISRAYSERTGADIVTNIETLDGLDDVVICFTNTTVTSKKEAIDKLINDMTHCTKGKITLQNDILRPKVLMGNTNKLIQESLQPNEKYYIDNEKIYIVKDNEVISDFAPVINSATGLLNAPTRQNKIVEVQTLINPELKVRGLAILESELSPHLNGTYKILSISYSGDWNGQDWKQSVKMQMTNKYEVLK